MKPFVIELYPIWNRFFMGISGLSFKKVFSQQQNILRHTFGVRYSLGCLKEALLPFHQPQNVWSGPHTALEAQITYLGLWVYFSLHILLLCFLLHKKKDILVSSDFAPCTVFISMHHCVPSKRILMIADLCLPKPACVAPGRRDWPRAGGRSHALGAHPYLPCKFQGDCQREQLWWGLSAMNLTVPRTGDLGPAWLRKTVESSCWLSRIACSPEPHSEANYPLMLAF